MKAPIFKFKNLDSTGLDRVPVNCLIVVEDSEDKPSQFLLKDKTGIDNTTRIRDIIDDVSKIELVGKDTIKKEVNSNTAANPGDLLFVDTSSNTVEITLPSNPKNFDRVEFIDSTSSFETNALIVKRGDNTHKIMGLEEDMTVNTKNISFGLIYKDGDWRLI